MNEVALSCSSKATGRPQALSRRNTLQVVAVGEPALVGDDVVLGAVAGGDVVLGDHRDQVGAGDAVDFLGLSFGDECAGLAFFSGWGLGIHGWFCLSLREARNNKRCRSRYQQYFDADGSLSTTQSRD